MTLRCRRSGRRDRHPGRSGFVCRDGLPRPVGDHRRSLVGDTARVEDAQTDRRRLGVRPGPRASSKTWRWRHSRSARWAASRTSSVIAEIVSDYPDMPLVLDPFSSRMPDLGADGDDMLVAMRELLVPQTTLLLLSHGRTGAPGRDLARAERPRHADRGRHALIDLRLRVRVRHRHRRSDVHNVANSLYNESGRVRHDSWARQPGAFSGAGSTLSATIAAMLAQRPGRAGSRARSAGIHRRGAGACRPHGHGQADPGPPVLGARTGRPGLTPACRTIL